MIDKSSLMYIPENRKILIQGEDFVYLLPCEQLSSLISNFTITFPNELVISDNYTIMPHGSVTLVLFNYNDEIYSFLFGPTTKSIKVGDLANKCNVILIIEFQPAGFFPFIKINQKELTDKIIPFSLVDESLDNILSNIFTTSLYIEELLFKLEKMLLLNIQFQYPKELSLAIKNIIKMEGVITSVEISNNAFYCSRHLNRLFNFYLGMSMKSFSRLVKINKSIHLLNEKTNTLALICEKLGYYDVSHFIKDFKMVCNITPQEYRTNMSDFYSEIAKF